MPKKKSSNVPVYTSSQLCEAIESKEDVPIAAVRMNTDLLVNVKLHGLIRDHLEALYEAKKKSALVQNRIAKRLTWLIDALNGKKDLKTESLLLELLNTQSKIAKAQEKDPKYDVNLAILQAMASSTDAAAEAMFAKLQEYNTDTFTWAVTVALRFCSKEKVFDTFHDWVAPPPDTPKRKAAKAKAEAVTELLDLYQSGVLYAQGYAPESVSEDDPNHTDRVAPPDRLDDRWLNTAIEIENMDLVNALTFPGHKRTQEWAEKRLRDMTEHGKKSKVRGSKFVGLLIASDHPQKVDLHEQAIEYFLKKKDTWEVAICLEMIPRLPKSATARIKAIDMPDELAEIRDQFVGQTEK